MSITDTATHDQPTPQVDTRRQAYIDGLRKLADLLERHDVIPLPYHGEAPYPFSVTMHGHATVGRDELAIFAAEIENPREELDRDSYRMSGQLDGLHVSLHAKPANIGREVTREQTVFEVEPILSTVDA